MPKTAKSKKRETVENAAETVETNQPTIEEISQRAYEIYLERGGAHGSDIEDWLQAERELRGEK